MHQDAAPLARLSRQKTFPTGPSVRDWCSELSGGQIDDLAGLGMLEEPMRCAFVAHEHGLPAGPSLVEERLGRDVAVAGNRVRATTPRLAAEVVTRRKGLLDLLCEREFVLVHMSFYLGRVN